MRQHTTAMALALATLTLRSGPVAAAAYDIDSLGLTDGPYTRSDGHRFSVAYRLHDAGAVAGHSRRFGPAGEDLGTSGWVYSPLLGTTERTGLTAAANTSAAGYHYTQVEALNASGWAAGLTYRVSSAGAFLGSSAWLHRPGLGSSGVGPTVGGNAAAAAINDAGTVLGRTDLPSGSTWTWIDSPGEAAIRIGLITGPHSSGDTQISRPVALNAAGHAIGTSNRFGGGGGATSAWFYSPTGGTQQIGLFDAEHTGGQDREISAPVSLGADGMVTGHSMRYGGAFNNTQVGFSIWSFTPAGGTVRVGVTDPMLTGNSGTQRAVVQDVNLAGHAIGRTDYYTSNLSGYRSTDAWFFSPDTGTVRLGLTGPEFTRESDGRQFSEAFGLTHAGHAFGRSEIFDEDIADDFDTATWFFTPATGTRRIGLVDATHTRADGYQESEFSSAFKPTNFVGQAVGYSLRFAPGTGEDRGQSAWFYDLDTDVSHPLVFSTRADGYAFSMPSFLSEDGVVLGTYRRYDGDVDLGPHAFAWSLDSGFADLGALFGAELDDLGWQRLSDAIRVTADGHFVGYGLPVGQPSGQLAYFIAVPEPSTLLVPSAALLTLLRRRRA